MYKPDKVSLVVVRLHAPCPVVPPRVVSSSRQFARILANCKSLSIFISIIVRIGSRDETFHSYIICFVIVIKNLDFIIRPTNVQYRSFSKDIHFQATHHEKLVRLVICSVT